jgi:hypothetical protein
MKKMVLGLSLALVTLGFLVSPATAADPPQAPRTLSVAEQAFLASLAKQVGTPDPVPAAQRPRRIGMEKALCSATASCGDGTTVYCESNTSATSCSAADRNCPEQGHVTCNGVTTWCSTPCPGCGLNFCTWQDEDNCAANCYPCSYTFTCNTTYCTENCRCNFRTCPV